MKNRFSLIQYSAAAVALLGTTAALSQVIYTDIDPDVVLNEPGEVFGIDLDDDGLNDFNFFNKSFTTYIPYAGSALVNAIFVGAFDTTQNGIAGSTIYISAGPGYTYYLPYAIQPDEVIGLSKIFYNDNYQTLARTESIFSLPFIFHQGNWHPSLWGYKLEDFLGFRFTDEESIQRYGWIRCSVIDSGRTLIIHDYAYELQPDYPILTGDTVSYVNINEQSNLLIASVYSFNTSIFIHINELLSGVEIHFYDLSGKLIYSEKIINQFTEIKLNEANGVYVVKLIAGESEFVKKIYLN